MVKEIQAYITSQRYPNVTAAGAIDAERSWWFFYSDEQKRLVPNPQPTLNWAKGYDSVPNRLPFYNFGSMDGSFRDSSWEAPSCDDACREILRVVYLLSGGVIVTNGVVSESITSGRPLPQSYRWPYAKEWYQLKRYSFYKQPITITIAGVMTEQGSAARRFEDSQGWPEISESIDLSPAQGWQVMYDTLNRTLIQDYALPTNLVTTDFFRVAPHTTL